ncbi:hypothetical protein [Bacillus sp. MMSF_3328]|uniref:hypothetical protein n=1 Tax=Bacillus sp. MMSF_3328 TaxID=3047080 RepID=UPI00273FC3A1|nr:hypothetical protein [Bacillus sp. MMSF_3328]
MKINEVTKGYIATSLLLIIYITLFLLLLKSFFKIESSIFIAIIGFVGAIVGGTISGFLTLQGVSLTLKQQQLDRLDEKNNLYNLTFNELLHRNMTLQTSIKSLNSNNISDKLDKVYYDAKNLSEVSKRLFVDAAKINPEVLRVLRSTSWDADDVWEFIDFASENDYETDYIIHELMTNYYPRIARNDSELESHGADLRKQIYNINQ